MYLDAFPTLPQYCDRCVSKLCFKGKTM